MTKLVGILGKKNTGKDTVGNYLVEKHGFSRVAFADPVKWVARRLFPGLTEAQCWGPATAKETVDPALGVTPRWIFQVVGTEIGRHGLLDVLSGLGVSPEKVQEALGFYKVKVGPTAWIDAMFEGAMPEKAVITDVRFVNESQAILRHEGTVWKVQRPGAATGEFENHPSETEVDACAWDRIIVNNSTLDDLYAEVDLLLEIS